MSEPLLIEGFFALGCGARNDTLALINKVVGQLSLEAEIREITVNSVDEAKELRFQGSPSIHISRYTVDYGGRGMKIKLVYTMMLLMFLLPIVVLAAEEQGKESPR